MSFDLQRSDKQRRADDWFANQFGAANWQTIKALEAENLKLLKLVNECNAAHRQKIDRRSESRNGQKEAIFESFGFQGLVQQRKR